MAKKSSVQWVKIELGDEVFTYEVGMKIRDLVIFKIVIISNNVDKQNVIYAQDRNEVTIFQANNVSYLAEHSL